MFEIGEKVVYGGDGVFKVESIGPLDISGIPKDKMYYTLKAVAGRESRIFSPVENEGMVIRAVMTKDEALSLIDSIKGAEVFDVPEDKKRENIYKEALRKYDHEELVKVLKTLWLRCMAKLEEGKKVTALDEKYFHIAKERLYGELAVALDIPRDDVDAFVEERLEGR